MGLGLEVHFALCGSEEGGLGMGVELERGAERRDFWARGSAFGGRSTKWKV